MIDILILEDNNESLTALTAMVEEIAEDINVFGAKTIEEARSILEKQKNLSLFLLDINLNEKNVEDIGGMDFAKEVRGHYEYEFVPIVFVTSILSMELTSYREIQCYQYITKPFEKEKVQTIIRRILNHVKEEKEYVLIKKEGINYKISCEDIVFIQAVPRGIKILLTKEELDVKYLSLKQILPKLSKQNFFQCHRMFIVNRKYIEYVDTVNQVIKMLGTKEWIEIGVTYKSKIKEWVNE